MYELIIIGAGPAGISMAAEARSVGIPSEQVLVLEKGPMHSWAIRKFYPAGKVVLANYKGIEAVCKGVLCISDMSKDQTLTYIDRAIEEFQIRVHYDEAVNAIRPLPGTGFAVETSQARYETPVCDSDRHPGQAEQTQLPDSSSAEQTDSLRYQLCGVTEPGLSRRRRW